MAGRVSWDVPVRAGVQFVTRQWRGSGFGHFGRGARIGKNTRISNRRNVYLAECVILYEDCQILSDGGTFVIGPGSHLAAGVYVNVVRGEVRLGAGVAVGPRSVLLGYTNHYEPGRPNTEVRRAGRVIVEDGAFLGAHVVVLPDVRIGEGAVVGAGAVVSRNVPPYTVVAGVPARVIRHLPVPGMGEPVDGG